jgi:hypothetical protein
MEQGGSREDGQGELLAATSDTYVIIEEEGGGGPRALKGQCLRYIEEHFDAIPDLRRLPGVVAQQVLEYMMKRRKGGSRTLNDVNVRKFLLHEVRPPPKSIYLSIHLSLLASCIDSWAQREE